MIDTHASLHDLLAGRRIAVTGTNRGIGRAVVEACADAGADLLVHARTAAAAEATAAALTQRPGAGRVASVHGDLRDPGLAGRLAAAAEQALGGLDVLFLSAAALGPMEALADTDFAAFREVMEINVDAQLRLFVGALPLLRRGGGAALWMTSGLGHFALARFGAYCASKHALEGLAKLAAVEHGDDGIVSVMVGPGMVRTEMLDAAMLGGDTSGFTAPAAAGRGFARLVADLDPSMNGQLVEVGRYLNAQ